MLLVQMYSPFRSTHELPKLLEVTLLLNGLGGSIVACGGVIRMLEGITDVC